LLNWAHIHIAINHLPVIGLIVLIALLGLGLWRKSGDLERASLEMFVALALLTIPVYLTGSPASKQLEALGVSRETIHQHSDAADYALGGIEILGALSLGALIKFRRQPLVPSRIVMGLLALAVVVLAMMARTANLGGRIRHPEIQSSRAARATVAERWSKGGWLPALEPGPADSETPHNPAPRPRI
jgi:uncharacterized membrane protein